LELGLYTDSLSEIPFERALDIAAECGIRSIEIATGGQSTAPHLDIDALLTDAAQRRRFLDAFASRGLHISALNCSAWPMHPVVGEAHAAVIDKTLRLAAHLEVSTVVTMSGCPGDGPHATTIGWTWYPWPDDAVALGRRNWDAAVRFWTDRGRLAERSGVTRIAFELHPLHVVYNVPTLVAFRAEVGDTIGANLDPSHLFWQGMDPIAVVRALGSAVSHVHLKDTEIQAGQVALAGVLDDRSFATPADRAWIFRTVGRIHPAPYWAAFLDALRDVGYEGSLSIEQEDPYSTQEEGVREAAAFMTGLISRSPAPPPGAAGSART
jgi:sugar phosphate isomerase/epimerase